MKNLNVRDHDECSSSKYCNDEARSKPEKQREQGKKHQSQKKVNGIKNSIQVGEKSEDRSQRKIFSQLLEFSATWCPCRVQE
jgi:hypothetical protein